METKVTSPAIKGTLLALVLIAFSLVTYFMGYAGNKSLSYIGMAIFGAAIIFSNIYYAKQNNGNVTFGNTFADGFKATAAATAISLVYTYLALKFIMPDVADISLEEARKGMAANKDVTAEQINQSLSVMEKFFVPISIGVIMFTYLLIGLIASLIGAAVAKKNPEPSPFAK